MRFHFRLEKILNLLRLREISKKMEVASAIRELDKLNRKKAQLNETIRTLLSKEQEVLAEGGALNFYRAEKIGIDRHEILRLEKAMDEAKNRVEQRRAELSKMAMTRKAIESLREKRHQDFRHEETRRVQKSMDESFRNSLMGRVKKFQ